MDHHWCRSGPGAHFCARCGLEARDDERASAPAVCTPPPVAMCKHAGPLRPFGLVIIAVLPQDGHEGSRYEMNCCRACWLQITLLVGELELKP